MEVIGHKNVSSNGDVVFLGAFPVARERAVGGPRRLLKYWSGVALLGILALAKARSAAPISAAISAQRATKASAKINATVAGARQKGSWRRPSVVTARSGDAPPSLLAIRPSASTR